MAKYFKDFNLRKTIKNVTVNTYKLQNVINNSKTTREILKLNSFETLKCYII